MATARISELPRYQHWLINYMKDMELKPYEVGICFGMAVRAALAYLAGEQDQFDQHLLNVYEQNRDSQTHAFCQNVILANQANHFEDMLGVNKQLLNTASLTHILPLVLNDKLRDQAPNDAGNAVQIAVHLTGIYTPDDLLMYFRSYKKAVMESAVVPSHPVVSILNAIDHAIMVAYDRQRETWVIVNASHLSVRDVKDDEEMTYLALEALGATNDNYTVAFSTVWLTTKLQKSTISSIAQAWQASSDYRLLHTVTRAKANLKSASSMSWLSIAAIEGDETKVDELLACGAEVNLVKDKQGYTPVYLAANAGHDGVLKKLINAGGDVNRAELINGTSPLQSAVHSGQEQAANVLLDAKANVNVVCKKNNSPLYVAVWGDRTNMVRALLANGANQFQKGEDGFTPVQKALARGNVEIYDILMEDMRKPKKPTVTAMSIFAQPAVLPPVPIVSGRKEKKNAKSSGCSLM